MLKILKKSSDSVYTIKPIKNYNHAKKEFDPGDFLIVNGIKVSKASLSSLNI